METPKFSSSYSGTDILIYDYVSGTLKNVKFDPNKKYVGVRAANNTIIMTDETGAAWSVLPLKNL